MKIADAFAADDGGFIVVGCDPETADISDSEFEGLRAKEVILIGINGDRSNANVVDVNVSRSLAGQRNIMIGFKDGVNTKAEYVGGYVTWEH